MNKFSRLILLGLLTTTSSFAGSISKGRDFQSKVLNMRVMEIVETRLPGLKSCAAKSKGLASQGLLRFESDLKAHKKTRYENHFEKLKVSLELMGQTQEYSTCREEIKAADRVLFDKQRKKFAIPKKLALGTCALSLPGPGNLCLAKVSSILAELDPFCVTQNTEDSFGVKDPNPCMAGDRIIGRVMRQKRDPRQERITAFLDSLESEIDRKKTGARVDLWQVYLRDTVDTAENRKKFLGLLSFLYYSLGSAGGYLDGVAEVYWRGSFNERNTPEEVFEEFYSMKQKLDRYRFLINKKAKDKGLRFTFRTKAIDQMNRHDFMAMFLACHFRSHDSITARVLPNFLGIGYESLDFASHLREDVSWKNSIDNFRTDTKRYSAGSSLGISFCEFKGE